MSKDPISLANLGSVDAATKLAGVPHARKFVLDLSDRCAQAHGALLAAIEREGDARTRLEFATREQRRFEEQVRSPRPPRGPGFEAFKGGEDDEAKAQRLDAAVETATADRDRARAVRDEARERYQVLKRLEDHLADTLANVRANQIRPARAPAVPKGATIEKTRAEIVALVEEIERVERAPVPRDELVAAMGGEVDAIAAKGEPRINARARGGSPVNLSDLISIGVGSGANIITGLGPTMVLVKLDEIKARLAALIPDAPDALTDAQRETRLRDLLGRKLEAERIEEALVRQAEAEGRILVRREDVDARAVLGVEFERAA